MLTLFLHLILSHSHAEIANAGKVSKSTERYSRTCLRKFERAGCDSFFAENPELLPYKVNCAAPPDPSRELKSLAEGGKHGAKEAWDLIRGIGTFLVTGPQTTDEQKAQEAYFANCARSRDCKVNLLRSVRREEVSEDFEQRLESIQDGTKLSALVDLNKRQMSRNQTNEVSRLLREWPDGPGRDAKIAEILPDWPRRLDQTSQSLWDLGLGGADRLIKKSACYSYDVQAEAVGYGLSTLLIPGAAIKLGPKLKNIVSILARPKSWERLARISWAERVTGQKIAGNSKLEDAIVDAHKVGQGQIGRDGKNLAGFGNYTDDQLREKLRILSEGGFDPPSSKNLIRRGVAGHDAATMKLIARAESEFDRLELMTAHFASDAQKLAAIQKLQNRLLEECIGKGVGCKEILEQSHMIVAPFKITNVADATSTKTGFPRSLKIRRSKVRSRSLENQPRTRFAKKF